MLFNYICSNITKAKFWINLQLSICKQSHWSYQSTCHHICIPNLKHDNIGSDTTKGIRVDYTSANQNFLPGKPGTTTVIDHEITTRHAVVELNEAHRGNVVVLRIAPLRPPNKFCAACPSATDAAPLRYPHVHSGCITCRTARSRHGTRIGSCGGWVEWSTLNNSSHSLLYRCPWWASMLEAH
jgi:hypothetical protein